MVAVSNPVRFIIVRFSSHRPNFRNNTLRIEIFYSKYNRWRRSKDIKLPHPTLILCGSAIFSNGAFHWLTNDDYVFAFDLNEANWITVLLPEEVVVMGEKNQKELVKYESHLALFFVGDEWIDLWVLDATEFWNKRKTIVVNNPDQCINFSDIYTSDVTFTTGFDKAMWYNLNNRSRTEVEVKDCICP
ncbi:hypothetical protein IFM89_004291 [Coptis chinensis]|uniref:F-box associated domain-containing protein n=1 Tax=Coptis chinensis TaxID=261450 RepID=A0A835I5D1_9MAGN|nr:hypothetical protein IFM89_004291 [Coptis chinensis]